MVYFYLAIAIIVEVVAASALKSSEGFTRPVPTAIVIVGCLTAVMHKQIPDAPAIIGMGLIITGVIIINVFSKSEAH